MMVPMIYEGWDDEEEFETVPTNNKNNDNLNVVSDFKSDEEAKETFLMKLMMASK